MGKKKGRAEMDKSRTPFGGCAPRLRSPTNCSLRRDVKQTYHCLPEVQVRAIQQRILAFGTSRPLYLWHDAADPYQILVAEVLTRSTRVADIVPIYERPIKTFPSVGILAEAPISEVRAKIGPLGLPNRAETLVERARGILSRLVAVFSGHSRNS